METPEFKSALDYCEVRDFAYPVFHPLHYGVAIPAEPEDAVDGSNEEKSNESEELKQVDIPVGEDQVIYYSPDDIYRRAVALFDFVPENTNEIELVEGQVVWISYRHGQGWLVAENLETGATGLVPEEYVQLIPGEDDGWEDAEGEEQQAVTGNLTAETETSGADGETQTEIEAGLEKLDVNDVNKKNA
ncbi:NAP1-binding protein 2 [Wickerhamiella sorbophila]|uniref:NAP1-binding protein 2 n=1 Tax=Wickerhamiella sorbophila TaxID=45607 RepID=A0A2T0FLQ4_9ASCO|nr:NAP1-binding protein 2 [Wickerhamiella sorbophila]PRT55905.1 NAP1-binding protein 2 [Wickerhamiella sorbophila]